MVLCMKTHKFTSTRTNTHPEITPTNSMTNKIIDPTEKEQRARDIYFEIHVTKNSCHKSQSKAQ